MITLYSFGLSGNSYKVRLLLELLNVEYELKDLNLAKGEHKTPDYLAIHPLGQVPALVDGDVTVTDSQAILIYLAKAYGGTDWLPEETLPMIEVTKWLFTAAGEVRQGPESARLYHLFGAKSISIEHATQKSASILSALDMHLSANSWLALDHPTIADVAVFPYVALARDGKVELDDYPNVLAWIERVKQLPRFVPIKGI